MGVTTREATVADADAIARVHHTAWREAYLHLLPQEVWPDDEARKREMWRRSLADPDSGMTARVAVRDGAIVGLAAVGPTTTADAAAPARDRELWVLYVLASEYGTGTGAAPLDAVLGDVSVQLWVFEANPRARAFYIKHGFRPEGTRHLTGPGLGDQPEIRMVR